MRLISNDSILDELPVEYRLNWVHITIKVNIGKIAENIRHSVFNERHYVLNW